MLTHAKKHKYDSILYLSWSCWFPRNGKPCRKCAMCRFRVIGNILKQKINKRKHNKQKIPKSNKQKIPKVKFRVYSSIPYFFKYKGKKV